MLNSYVIQLICNFLVSLLAFSNVDCIYNVIVYVHYIFLLFVYLQHSLIAVD